MASYHEASSEVIMTLAGPGKVMGAISSVAGGSLSGEGMQQGSRSV